MLRAERYIARQVLTTTVFAVFVLSIVLVLGTLFKVARPMLVEDQASIWLVGKVLFSVMPSTLMFTLPWGFLVSVLLVFGRLSADNEIVSLRLAGLSHLRIALPAIIIGAVLSGVSLWLNATVAPNSKAAQKDILYNTIQRDPGILLQPGIVQSRLKEGQVFVEERTESDQLLNFHFLKFDDPQKKEQTKGPEESDASESAADINGNAYAFARSAQLVVEPEVRQLRLSLSDNYFETEDADGMIQPIRTDSLEPVLFDFAAFERRGRDKPSGMENALIREKLRDAANLPERTVEKLHIELAKRYAFSGACLAFACIGIPLAMQRQRRDTSAGFGLSLGIAGVYFLLLIVGEQAGKNAAPVMALPNIAAIVIGLYLLRRRDTY